MRAKVELNYAGMTTTVDVPCDEDEEDAPVKARAWEVARRRGWLTLPMAAQSATVVERT